MSMPSLAAVDKVILMGFMGSGKTTVGKLLAKRLGWAFIDLDAVVEERCARTVPEIFAEFGEPHFRSEESAALHGLAERSQIIIALGGGATEHAANQALLRRLPQTAVIYLQAPFAQLQDRCSQQASQPGSTPRPLLADLAAAQQRYERRLPVYQQISTHQVDTSGRSPNQVVGAILLHLA